MDSITNARINWNRGVAWKNFVTKSSFGMMKQRENMPLLYDVIAVTEVFLPPFLQFCSEFCKSRQNRIKPVLHGEKPGQVLDKHND
jgi:hypothetical protein